ncbi:MAG: hypothetical protein ACR2LC_09450 [Pyrinomonadaceae bacterium]
MSNPALLDVSAACGRLQAFARQSGLNYSLDFLESVSGSLDVLKLYKAIFPKEFAASRAPAFAPHETGRARTKREMEFLSLINDRLFPLDIDLYEGEDSRVFAFDLQIVTLAGAEWQEGDYIYENLSVSFQLALLMLDLFSEARTGTNYTDHYFEHLQTRYDLPGKLKPLACASYGKLIAAFLREKSPLKDLALVCEMIGYQTGNIFFDYVPGYDEGGYQMEWSTENIERLTGQYKVAVVMNDAVNDLNAWILEEPRARISRALSIHQFLVKNKRDGKDTTEQNDHGRTLVDVFSGSVPVSDLGLDDWRAETQIRLHGGS